MNYGKTTFNNEVYTLTSEAVFDNQQYNNGEEYYVADAIKDGKEYQVYFLIIDGGNEEASNACDWENADFIEEVE